MVIYNYILLILYIVFKILALKYHSSCPDLLLQSEIYLEKIRNRLDKCHLIISEKYNENDNE